MEQLRGDNEEMLQQMARYKQSFIDKLHLIHEKIDAQNSIRSVECNEEVTYDLVMEAVGQLKECLRLSECKLNDMEITHHEEMQELRQYTHQ
jgi:hypothetical protein